MHHSINTDIRWCLFYMRLQPTWANLVLMLIVVAAWFIHRLILGEQRPDYFTILTQQISLITLCNRLSLSAFLFKLHIHYNMRLMTCIFSSKLCTYDGYYYDNANTPQPKYSFPSHHKGKHVSFDLNSNWQIRDKAEKERKNISFRHSVNWRSALYWRVLAWLTTIVREDKWQNICEDLQEISN